MHPTRSPQRPDRDAALAQYRERAEHYDNELALFEPIRQETIAKLKLHSGDTVLDVGCGTGLSFDALRRAVGPRGRIIGIEQCPEMLAQAHARAEGAGWRNVTLVRAPAETAAFDARADAALFVFTHDVLRQAQAVDNIMNHLRPGAHIAACGLQWAPPWAWWTNGFVAMAAMYSMTSFEGMSRPWDKLGERLKSLQVQTTALGGIYIADGVFSPPH